MEPSEAGWKRQRRLAPVREELEQIALAQPRGALLAGAAQLAGQPLVQLAGSLLETDRTLNITDQSGRAGGLAGSWDRASAHGNVQLHGDRDSGPMYQYNLKTTGYPSGTYTLGFTVTGDPVTHTVEFVIR